MNGIDPVSYRMHTDNPHISHECVKQIVAPNNELSVSFKYFFLHSSDFVCSIQHKTNNIKLLLDQ